MSKKITVLDIDKLAESLNLAQNNLTLESDKLNEKITDAWKGHRAELRRLLKIVVAKRLALLETIKNNRNIFKSPKSRVISVIKFGYSKTQDKFEYPDDDVLTKLIEKHIPDDETLIKTTKKPVKDRIKKLKKDVLGKIKVKKITGKDKAFITVIESDVDKIIETILADIKKEEEKK